MVSLKTTNSIHNSPKSCQTTTTLFFFSIAHAKERDQYETGPQRAFSSVFIQQLESVRTAIRSNTTDRQTLETNEQTASLQQPGFKLNRQQPVWLESFTQSTAVPGKGHACRTDNISTHFKPLKDCF